jgi:hypothetical protein
MGHIGRESDMSDLTEEYAETVLVLEGMQRVPSACWSSDAKLFCNSGHRELGGLISARDEQA